MKNYDFENNNGVSVIIPTYNEERSIGRMLVEIPNQAVNEVIVVDSSTDKTSRIAESLGAIVIKEPRMGYGRALQTGIKKARYSIIIIIDGDHSYDPREIPHLIDSILKGKCDVVLGSRFKGKMFLGSMTTLNKFGNIFLSLIFSILFFKRITDSQTGFRAFRKAVLLKTIENHGMPFVTEQLIKILKGGARVEEVPITYRPRIGKTKLHPWNDGFKILKCIFKEFFSKTHHPKNVSNEVSG